MIKAIPIRYTGYAILMALLFVQPGPIMAQDSYPEFLLRPYLTDLNEMSATLNWRTKKGEESLIEYGISYDYELGTIRLPAAKQQTIKLDNLKADTYYYYNVNNTFKGTFKTESETESYRFIALGHTHGSEGFAQYPDRLLISTIESLDPDFIIHMGDATYFSNINDYRDYFFHEFRKLLSSVPLYMSPGNHDAGWPFVYGRGLHTFKELFPYPYPKDIVRNKDDAHYAVKKKNIQFVFLSYTSDLRIDSVQAKWLTATLSASDAEFTIVVFGGAQKGYYDRPALLDVLAKHRVDLILNGDGSQSENEPLSHHKGIPIFFAGTNGDKPHLFLLFEYEKGHLVIKQLDATGRQISTSWLYSKKRYPSKLDLSQGSAAGVFKKGQMNLEVKFDRPLRSDEITGMQVDIQRKVSNQGLIYAYITPTDIVPNIPNNEGGFRTQYHQINDADHLVTLTFPQKNPFTGQSYMIKRLRVTITGVTKAEDIVINKLYLF